MKHITMIICLLASCITTNYEGRCQITDEDNCPGNGGGGSPGDQERAFAAVDDWASGQGLQVVDQTCDASGTHCSMVHVSVTSVNTGFFRLDCTITTVVTNGTSTSTASCHSS